MYRSVALTDRDGCAAATPASASASTSSGALINFFTTSSLYLQGRSGRDADPLGGGLDRRRGLDRTEERVRGGRQQTGGEGGEEVHRYLVPQQPGTAAERRPRHHRTQ